MTTNDSNHQDAAYGPIMARLKAETAACHARLEALPFFEALAQHRLPLACYVNQLGALAIIHGVFEQEMAAGGHEYISTIWSDDLRKLPWLEKDLAFFAPRGLARDALCVQAAHAVTAAIRLRKIEKPVSLLGYLYVLEGSTLGNAMHRPDVAATFHLDGRSGCRYYAGYGDGVQIRWERFSHTVDNLLADHALHGPVVDAAEDAFQGLEALYEALYPLKGEGNLHVSQINPEAGLHPMPEDQREIQAALEASTRVWNAFPYFAQRYGARGKRFADSDACWLVTLTALDPSALQQQIDWLCRVLATRGMPSLMMEQTLRCLEKALSEAVPEKTPAYHKLGLAADTVQSTREKVINDHVLEMLAREFDHAVGEGLANANRQTGRLLVAAVADERNGIEGAVDDLTAWMTDERRFPQHWIRAVVETIARARDVAL